LIILFTLLGLSGLAGGAWAIVDGLPYLVLERGFTQVIVGTVLSTGGVLLLALACVLAELKRARKTLANAMMAASVASMASERADPMVAAPVIAPMAASPDRPDVAIASAGAAAAVGAALAAGASWDRPGAQEADEAQKPFEEEAQNPSEEAVADEGEPEPSASPARSEDMPPSLVSTTADATTEPTDGSAPANIPEERPEPPVLENVWSAEPLDEPPIPEPVEAGIRPDIEDPFAEAVSGVASPDPHEPIFAPAFRLEADDASERDGASWADDAAALDDDAQAARPALDPAARIEPVLAWPSESEPVPERDRREPAMPDIADPGDEFSFLRESLSGRALQRDDASSADGLESAGEGWMAGRSGRQEPWFGDREAEPDDAVTAPDQATLGRDTSDLAPPPWPPVTRQPEPIDAELNDEENRPAEIDDAPAEDPAIGEPMIEAAAAADDAPDGDAAPAPVEPAPAASEEGVVGAYQVGDAQFTIYADGSIQARTPDGDYTFASMEELKTYLASEKSRLGA
jgi:hypothetical protein